MLFIPDISGFSRFVNETEIEHSRLIIQELLETLIDANHIGLEISEIEGDAILFYRFGTVPDLRQLYEQVERMFCAFHRNILAYDLRRYCQCKACVGAVDLTLKVITHYGEFTGYSVKAFHKLIGKDVIIAHELLKNDIEHHEYWLVTQSLLGAGQPDGLTAWMRWNAGAKLTRGGEVPFQYTQLTQLREAIPPEPAPRAEWTGRVRMITATRDYEADIITLFHATGDFNHRARWQHGVRRVEEVDHLLPRVGMRCRCIRDDGDTVLCSSTYHYHPDRIEFSETEERSGGVTRFVLEKLGSRRTRLTLEYYVPRSRTAEIVFRLTAKRKLERSIDRSLRNLVELVKEIRVPSSAEAR